MSKEPDIMHSFGNITHICVTFRGKNRCLRGVFCDTLQKPILNTPLDGH